MPTTHRPDSPLDRPGELIAALPAVLGFVPEKSLVLVTAAHGEMGAVMRADLCAEVDGDSLGHFAELAAASRAEVAIAVIVEDGGDRALAATGGSVAAPVGRAVIAAGLQGR